jgi:four helix bundle protein
MGPVVPCDTLSLSGYTRKIAVGKMEKSNGNWNMENGQTRPAIKTFQDLVVYQNLYQAMVLVHRDVVSRLPKDERFDLVDQMKRASKAGPALLAEGFAKRYQKRQWQKYLNDTIGECNEMIHHLTVCVDVYGQYVDPVLCRRLIGTYDASCKQLTRLGQHWQNFHDRKDR